MSFWRKLWPRYSAGEVRLIHAINDLRNEVVKMAQELDDLNAAVAQMGNAVNAAIAAGIGGGNSQPPAAIGIDPAAVANAAAGIVALANKLTNAIPSSQPASTSSTVTDAVNAGPGAKGGPGSP